MWLPFRKQKEHDLEVYLHVELGFQSARLADLVQLLARSKATITDLSSDRSVYIYGMPERWAEIKFLTRSERHKKEILQKLSENGFRVRETAGPIL